MTDRLAEKEQAEKSAALLRLISNLGILRYRSGCSPAATAQKLNVEAEQVMTKIQCAIADLVAVSGAPAGPQGSDAKDAARWRAVRLDPNALIAFESHDGIEFGDTPEKLDALADRAVRAAKANAGEPT